MNQDAQTKVDICESNCVAHQQKKKGTQHAIQDQMNAQQQK